MPEVLDFLWLLLPLLCELLLWELLLWELEDFELEDFPEVDEGAELEDPAAGVSAASAAAARPKVNKAETINVPDLFMDSPNYGGDWRAKEY